MQANHRHSFEFKSLVLPPQAPLAINGLPKVIMLVVVLILALGIAAPAAAENGKESQHTLNIKDAEITTVIEAVSRMTGKNFIIDPRVKGKVTIISNSPMKSEEIYQVFLSVLKVHGFAAVPGDNVTKIIPEVGAKQDAVEVINGSRRSQGDEFVTRVVEVKYVDAAQLVPILRPLVPQRGHLAAYPASNMLVVSDSAANIRRLVKIISRIDQSSSDELEVITLESASATEVVRILDQLEKKDAKGKGASRVKIIADERTNSILLSGDKASRLRLRAVIAHLDTTTDVGAATHVIYLKNANAKDLVPVLTGVTQNIVAAGKRTTARGGTATAAIKGPTDIFIQADETTNALVINAPPDVFRALRVVVQRLDIRRAQVLVEAIIAEVTNEFRRELGVQWAVDGSGGGNAVGLINFSLSTPITSLLGGLENPPAITGIGAAVGDLDGSTRFAALITALANDADTNLLSTPNILMLDNEEAELVVGQNVPFVTGSFSGTGGGSTPANPFQTIERQDVGLTLKLKPQINEGDAIKLDVEQEQSTVSDSTAGVDIITNKRSIKTSVMVDDDQMVVLGGLIRDELRQAEQKVPGLGDIPVIGALFRSQRTQKVKTNLMIFLHPVIVKTPELQAVIATEKYTFLRDKELELREKGVNLMKDEVSPLLPEVKGYLRLPPSYESVAGGNTMPRKNGGGLAMPPIEAPPLE